MSKPPLLIVEDDTELVDRYRRAVPGWTVLTAASRAEAMPIVAEERPAVAIVDLGLPPDPDGVSEGFASLAAMLKFSPEMKVVVAASNGGRANALRAVAAGAHDFYEKPVAPDVLRLIVERGFRLYDLELENRRLAETPTTGVMKRIITAAEPMLRACRDIEKLAQTDVPVLLQGERGTGKETLARALHELGPRAAGPFVAINCRAVPEAQLESELFGHEPGGTNGAAKRATGRIETADHGTLFLDEIDTLPRGLEIKLGQCLREQAIERIGGRQPVPVDVRIVAAMNRMAEPRLEVESFGVDFFHRLDFVSVRVPPLRERVGDPVLLARYFLNRFNREFCRNLRGLTPSALSVLAGHIWPGNVRELENRVKRAVIMAEGRMIDRADLELRVREEINESFVATHGASRVMVREGAPSTTCSVGPGKVVDGGPAPAITGRGHRARVEALISPRALTCSVPPGLDLRAARFRAEREVIAHALAQSRGRIAPAARLLGISRPTLYGLLEVHRVCGPADPRLWHASNPISERA